MEADFVRLFKKSMCHFMSEIMYTFKYINNYFKLVKFPLLWSLTPGIIYLLLPSVKLSWRILSA